MTKTAQQVEALFEAARQLSSAAARRAFLDEACVDDAPMRAKVEALLVAQEEADKFFNELSPFSRKQQQTEIQAEDTLPTEGPGSRIDRYKLLQKIGEGGG